MHAQRVRRSLCDFIMMNAHLNGSGARCEIVVAECLVWYVRFSYAYIVVVGGADKCGKVVGMICVLLAMCRDIYRWVVYVVVMVCVVELFFGL